MIPDVGTIASARKPNSREFFPCKILGIKGGQVHVEWALTQTKEWLPAEDGLFELQKKRQRVQAKREGFTYLDSDDEAAMAVSDNEGDERPTKKRGPKFGSKVTMKMSAKKQKVEEEYQEVYDLDEDDDADATEVYRKESSTRRSGRHKQRATYMEPDENDIYDLELESTGGDYDTDETEDEEKADHVGIRKRTAASRHPLTSADIAESARIGLQSLSAFREKMRPFLSTAAYSILEKTAATIPKHLKLNTEGEVDMADLPRVPQPSGLSPSVVLREYQLQGLSWLANQYKRGINSILADEMGLGKTLQSIAFISHLIHTEKRKGPHLVIVPLSVLFNWMQEFKKFCPSIKVIRLHANDKSEQNRMKGVIADASITEVVVTTYDLVKAGGLMKAIRAIYWNTIVLDEGHRIKNDEALITRACGNLKCRFKLILTGTPVQNNLHESFVLLSFLFPTIFTDSSAFDEAFDLSGRQDIVNAKGVLVPGKRELKVDRSTLSQAHYLMRPFILRRIKTEVEDKLPPKLETKISCPMSKMQRFWVQRLLFKERASLLKLQNDAEKSKDDHEWRKLQSIMTQLRKAANHPYLFPGVETVTEDGQPTEEIVTASGKMVVLDKLLKMLHERGHRVVLFSQYTKVLDILSDYLDWRGYKHNRLDGQTNRVMREVLINQFNKPNSPYFIFCLSTRAGGEGVNLFTADTVILFDSDWNPQVDLQAMARVHRIGQTKVVHIYRLVTVGSVEERIVQRAQKKLFLDGMINRGSTAQSRALDEDNGADAAVGDAEEEEPSNVLGALKFGWNAVFSASGDGDKTLSDEHIELIIDRARGLPGGEGGQEKAAKLAKLFENQEVSLTDFDETAPLISVREFEGQVVSRSDEKDTSAGSLEDIASVWRAANPEPLEETMGRGKRVITSRLIEMEVEGVGMVSVLKKNDYSLNDGEPSVHVRELADATAKKAKASREAIATFIPQKGRQIAGRDFSHQEHCQVCWDGGELLLCGQCPTAYHLACLGLSEVPASSTWSCPHHVCCLCFRKSSECGLLFRCEICPDAYCEDCMPVAQCDIKGTSERFSQLGFRNPSSCCFCVCSARCAYFAENGTDPPEDLGPKKKGKKASSASHSKQPKEPTGYAKEILLGIEGAVEDDHAASSGTVPSGRDSAEVIVPKKPASNVVSKSNPLDALDNCRLPDIKRRLERVYVPEDSVARQSSLGAIPSFRNQWTDAAPVCKLVFKQILDKINDVIRPESDMLSSADDDAALGSDHVVFSFAGVPSVASTTIQAQAFIDAVRLLSTVPKNPLIQIARLLNVVHFTPVVMGKREKELLATVITEPKFRAVNESTLGVRSKMEEAIACYLCTLLPQNMLIPLSTERRKKREEIENPDGTITYIELEPEEEKTENLAETIFYSARLLEATIHSASCPNNIFFTALSALNEGTRAFVEWRRNIGRMDEKEFNACMDPVRRLFACHCNNGVDLDGLPVELRRILASKASTFQEIQDLYEVARIVEEEIQWAVSDEDDDQNSKKYRGWGASKRAREAVDIENEAWAPDEPSKKLSFIQPPLMTSYEVTGPFHLFCRAIKSKMELNYSDLDASKRKAMYETAWAVLGDSIKQDFVEAYMADLSQRGNSGLDPVLHQGSLGSHYGSLEDQSPVPADLWEEIVHRAYTSFTTTYVEKLRSSMTSLQSMPTDLSTIEYIFVKAWNDLPADKKERFLQTGRESVQNVQVDCYKLAVAIEDEFYPSSECAPTGAADEDGKPIKRKKFPVKRELLVVPAVVQKYKPWHHVMDMSIAARDLERAAAIKALTKILLDIPRICWVNQTDFHTQLQAIELHLYLSSESMEEYQAESRMKERVLAMIEPLAEDKSAVAETAGADAADADAV